MTQTPERNQPAGTVVLTGTQARRRLAQMGLRPEHLRRAVEAGDLGQRRCGPLHPRQAAAQTMWFDTLAGLRAQLVALQEDWRAGRTGNYETAYHAGRRIAIAVVGGDNFTGLVGERNPRLKRKRGPLTHQRLNQNYQQLSLFPNLPESNNGPKDDVNVVTWFLVVYADADEIRLELSLPIGEDEAGYVALWDTRVLVESIPVSGAVLPIEPDDDGPDETLVPVGRR